MAGPLAVSAFADLPIRFIPFEGEQPDFIFDGTLAETSTHRYEVRTEIEEDEEGEEIQNQTLVRTDKGSGRDRVVFSPPANVELGVAVLQNNLVLKCGGVLFFVQSDTQFKVIKKWCIEGAPRNPSRAALVTAFRSGASPRCTARSTTPRASSSRSSTRCSR